MILQKLGVSQGLGIIGLLDREKVIKCVPLRWLYKIRRIKGRNKFLPSSVDGVVGDGGIAQLFF